MTGRTSHLAVEADSTRTVTLRLPDGPVLEGSVVDLRGVATDVAPAAVVDAIRAGCPTRPDRPTVHAPPPTRAHPHVARIEPGVTVDRGAALAAIGAARGVETPHDDDLAAARESLRSLSAPCVDVAELQSARRRAAEAGSEADRLRERVAALRGQVTALREAGDDAVADAEASLSAATRELSEAATERAAAEQRLSMLEERAQQSRDAREERLRLEDRVGNLERAVRRARADAVTPEFRDARQRVGSLLDATVGDDAGLRDTLAVASVAPLRAPVVVDPAVVSALGGRGAVADFVGRPIVVG